MFPLSKCQSQRSRNCHELIYHVIFHTIPVFSFRRANIVLLDQQSSHDSQFGKRQILPDAIVATCNLLLGQNDVSIPNENGAYAFLFLTISGLLYQRSGMNSLARSKQLSTSCASATVNLGRYIPFGSTHVYRLCVLERKSRYS